MAPCTLLLVRSEEFGWAGLRAALAAMPEVTVVGEATTARQVAAMAETASAAPDIVVATPRVDGASALPVLTEIRRDLWPAAKVVVLASRYVPGELPALTDLGISAFLLWDDLCPRTLQRCLAVVLERDIAVASAEVVQALIDTERGARRRAATVPLTEAERAVLRDLADGLTQDRIALREGCSLRTVSRAMTRLERKLNAPNQFVLGQQVERLGLLEEPETQGDVETPHERRKHASKMA
jgi:DNA-binding NarL/FixJ family response regulator